MRKYLLSFLLVLIFFVSGCASVAKTTVKPREEPRPKVGFLNVSSFPVFATVRIDKGHIGKTPLEKVSLSPGLHQVIISEEGYKNSENLVEIKSGETARLGAVLEKIGGYKKPQKPTVVAVTNNPVRHQRTVFPKYKVWYCGKFKIEVESICLEEERTTVTLLFTNKKEEKEYFWLYNPGKKTYLTDNSGNIYHYIATDGIGKHIQRSVHKAICEGKTDFPPQTPVRIKMIFPEISQNTKEINLYTGIDTGEGSHYSSSPDYLVSIKNIGISSFSNLTLGIIP